MLPSMGEPSLRAGEAVGVVLASGVGTKLVGQFDPAPRHILDQLLPCS